MRAGLPATPRLVTLRLQERALKYWEVLAVAERFAAELDQREDKRENTPEFDKWLRQSLSLRLSAAAKKKAKLLPPRDTQEYEWELRRARLEGHRKQRNLEGRPT